MYARLCLFALLASGSLACVHAPTEARAVAVVPVDALAVDPAEGEALRAAVEKQLSTATAHRAVPREKLGALDPGDAHCRESESCLAEAGRQLPTDLVLSMTVAGLGSTRLVRSRLITTKEGLVLQDLQETLMGGAPALDLFAQSLAQRLFPEPNPWYRRWWVWTLAGVAVAGAATTTAVLVTRSNANSGIIHLGNL
jgi:hypothetical protein